MKDINDVFINYISKLVGVEEYKIMTQENLSKLVGCTSVSMSRYLNKQRKIPMEVAFEIKKVLNIDDDLFMKFYKEYSTQTNSLIERYNNLSQESQIKLIEYLEYLEYCDKKEFKSNNF